MKTTAEKAQDPETQREPQDPGIGAWPQTSRPSLPPPLCPREESLRDKGETTLQLSTEHPWDSTHRVWGTMLVVQPLTQAGIIRICR